MVNPDQVDMSDERNSMMKGGAMEPAQHEALAAGSSAGPVRSGVGDRASVEVWHVYHLIGDALRSPELAGRCLDPSFVEGVMRCVERESMNPVLDDGQGEAAGVIAPPRLPLQGPSRQLAANDWNWSLVAGVASLAVALGVAWTLGGAWTGREVQQLAQTKPAVAPAVATAASPSEPQVMIRDPRLDELLAAHKQLGGTSALQKPAGFLRNAAFEDRSR